MNLNKNISKIDGQYFVLFNNESCSFCVLKRCAYCLDYEDCLNVLTYTNLPKIEININKYWNNLEDV